MPEKFNKFKPSAIPMEQFNSHLSKESDKDASTIATHFIIILHLLLSKGFISSFLKTVWDHTYGCTNQYHFTSAIYLLSCINLEFLSLSTEMLMYQSTERMSLMVL